MSSSKRPSADSSGKGVSITSKVTVLPADNIDTDQIIPARFLKITDTAGLGDHLFEDLRRSPDGSLRTDFSLNRPDRVGSAILVAGHNFGCGSSREHAAWALKGAGIRAVISTSFADIFKGNALKNGIIPVALQPDACAAIALLDRSETPVTVDLDSRKVSWGDERASFEIDPFARKCLLGGVDELGYILAREASISAFELRRKQRGEP